MCEDTKVLCVFVEENDDAFLVFDIGRDEDGDIGLGFLCTKGQTDLLEAKLFETPTYEFADSTCKRISDRMVKQCSFDQPFMASRWTQLWRSFLVRKNLKYAFGSLMLRISSLPLMK